MAAPSEPSAPSSLRRVPSRAAGVIGRLLRLPAQAASDDNAWSRFAADLVAADLLACWQERLAVGRA